MHLVGVCRPRSAACPRESWRGRLAGRALAAASLDAERRDGHDLRHRRRTAKIAAGAVESVIEATGSPAAGIRPCSVLRATASTSSWSTSRPMRSPGRCSRGAPREAGVVYSLAYGDQPALICEMVDWARAARLRGRAAGKGTKYLPGYHASTPDKVWGHYGFTPEEVAAGDFNAQMFNSFLDGTKSAIEMAAVANACGLDAAAGRPEFPPCGVDDLARMLRPRPTAARCAQRARSRSISSLERDGRPVFRDLRWGVYVVLRGADSDYVARCFKRIRPARPTTAAAIRRCTSRTI